MFSGGTSKSKFGKTGEGIACGYLVDNGYKVLARNYRRKWGEIDIVAKYKDGTLVFFEVKTMLDKPGGLKPEDQATFSKLSKVKRACEEFTGSHPELIDLKKGWRIDLLALTINGKGYIIKHYKNI